MIKKIVLTGGPSSGKTSVLEKIEQVFSSEGYKVIVVSEVATELMNSGITFRDGSISLFEFQELVLKTQLSKESVVDKYLEKTCVDKVLVVFDRGAMDNMAYIGKEDFEKVLKLYDSNLTFSDLMNNYDLVINLVGREDFYTLSNNRARNEDVGEALLLGQKTLQCWVGHKNLKIVMPKDTLDAKINEVLNLINEILKEKQVKRQERYLVDLDKTNMEFIKSNGKVMQIEQTYLESDSNVEKRLRKVTFNGGIFYVLSVFRILEDGTKVIFSEKSLDYKMYDNLMDFKDKRYDTLKKERYYFTYQGEYFNLDICNNSDSIGVLEINIGEDEEVLIPEYVSVVEKVNNNEYDFYKKIALKDGRKLEKRND